MIGVPTNSSGVVYNMKPTGDEPARVGIVVEAAGGLSKLFLQAPVYVRPGPDGYGLESTFADQPRTAGVPVQITKIALTFNARGSKGAFMRMPTSCAEGNSLSRANSWEAPNAISQKEFKMTPTGCNSLGFSPSAEGSMGAPGVTDAHEFPPVSTTLKFDPEEAALRRAEVILPLALGPNLPGAQRACPRAQADASSCPESSRVGTAIIDSPLQAGAGARPRLRRLQHLEPAARPAGPAARRRSACGSTAWSSRSSREHGTPSPRIPTCRCAASRSRSTAGGPTRRWS